MSVCGLDVAMDREDWTDYISTGCIMYCPPAQYSPEILSQRIKYSYLASVSARFLASPQYTRPTKKTIDALNVRGYALDNGAYLCHINKEDFDETAFLDFCARYGQYADWIVIPDVVCDATKTLKGVSIYTKKIRELLPKARLLLVWQDGMVRSDIIPYLKKGIGVFVGGSTEGKLMSMYWIAGLCREYGVWCHVGRVNSIKRLRAVMSCGANSFDGSGIVRYLPTLKLMTEYLICHRGQLSLFDNSQMDMRFLRSWLTRNRSLV
jgi:hypothetical protein